jgi:hypothetical protein
LKILLSLGGCKTKSSKELGLPEKLLSLFEFIIIDIRDLVNKNIIHIFLDSSDKAQLGYYSIFDLVKNTWVAQSF